MSWCRAVDSVITICGCFFSSADMNGLSMLRFKSCWRHLLYLMLNTCLSHNLVLCALCMTVHVFTNHSRVTVGLRCLRCSNARCDLTQCVKLSMQKAHTKTISRYKRCNALKLDRLYLLFRQMAHAHTKWAKSPKDDLACGVFGWLCPSPVCVLNGHLFSQSVSPIVQSGSIHIAAQLWSRMAKAHRTEGKVDSERQSSMAPWFLRAQCGCWPVEGNLVEMRTVSCIHSCEAARPLFLCDLLKRKLKVNWTWIPWGTFCLRTNCSFIDQEI